MSKLLKKYAISLYNKDLANYFVINIEFIEFHSLRKKIVYKIFI